MADKLTVKFSEPAASPALTSSMESVGVPSSSVIVPVPWASVILAFTAMVRSTKMVSSASSSRSSATVTTMFCVVIPGAKVSVPEVGV